MLKKYVILGLHNMSFGFSNIFQCLNRTQTIHSSVGIDEPLNDETIISVSSTNAIPITTQPTHFRLLSQSPSHMLLELKTYISSEAMIDDNATSARVLNETSFLSLAEQGSLTEQEPLVVSAQERFEQIRAQNLLDMQSAQTNFALNQEREAIALAKLEQENNRKITEIAGNIRLRRGQKIGLAKLDKIWAASGAEAELVKKAEGTKKAELKLTSEIGLNFAGFLGAQIRTGTGIGIQRQDEINKFTAFSEIAFENEWGLRVPGLAYDGLEPTSFVVKKVPAGGSAGLRTNYNVRHEWVTNETIVSKVKVGFIGACLNVSNVLGSVGGAIAGANVGLMELGAAAVGAFATGLATLSLNVIPLFRPTNRVGINMAAAELVATYRHRDLTDPTKLTDVSLRFEKRITESGGIFSPCLNVEYEEGQVDNYSALIFTPLNEIQEETEALQADDESLMEFDNDENHERMADLASEPEPPFNSNAQIVMAMVHSHQE